ncbi:TPA: hypothetical protein SL228_003600 [Pseudomonas aeruginosa]|nr:hypothetical protein [Pseudomonas aeruginosa]HCF6448267.1 hypothetical protein [Pseudomonas aeruginosa]HCK0599554.1 hypothetical protein [Pseudomonas aeruginosa]HEJ2836649.1 hypothetical protein [Pseudomonas aeruginosa]
MTLDELNVLLQLLDRLDAEAATIPDDQLQRLAWACQSGGSTLWSEREARNEGTSVHVATP